MDITKPVFYLQDSIASNGSVTDQSSSARAVKATSIVGVQDVDFGSCFEFSGSSSFEVSGFACPSSFSMAVWVKRKALPNLQQHILLEFDALKNQLSLKDLRLAINDLATVDVIRADVWVHVAFTYNATTKKSVLYVNGVQVVSKSDVTFAAGTALRIGKGASAASYPFQGRMAHILIYDGALSDAEVVLVKDATRKSMRPALLLQQTNQLDVKLVPDDSGNGRNATATSMTAATDSAMGTCFDLKNGGTLTYNGMKCPAAFTLSALVRWTGVSTATGTTPLIEFGAAAPKLSLANFKPTLSNGVASTSAIANNTWQHLAVTYNPITQKSVLYVEGKEVASKIGAVATTGTSLRIGGKSATADISFPGVVASIAVQEGALSANDLDAVRTYRYVKPRLSLPLGNSNSDISGSGNAVTCTGAASVTDANFGTAYQFDGIDDKIDVSALECTGSFTFAMYICPDTTSGTVEMPLMTFGTTKAQFGMYGANLRLLDGAVADSSLKPNVWHHVAVTYDATSKQVVLFVNGAPIKSGTFSGASMGGKGLAIGYFGGAWFKGRMRQVMMYDKALLAAQVMQLFAETRPVVAQSASASARPVAGLLKMDLVNRDDEPVLYILPNGEQQISLSIENTSAGDITLGSSGLSVGKECFHFQFQFRQGVLDSTFRDDLKAGKGTSFDTLKQLGWAVYVEDLGTGGDLISLLWKGTTVTPKAGDPPYLLNGIIGAGKRVLLPLANVRVKSGAGSRTSRVSLTYDNLQLANKTKLERGTRIELLCILSQEQNLASANMATLVNGLRKRQLAIDANMPLEIKVIGGILNDGGANTLQATIKNTFRSNGAAAAINLGSGSTADTAPKFYLSMSELFDAVDGSSTDNFTNVAATVSSSANRGWKIETVSTEKRWRLTPPSGNVFEKDEVLTITFSGLKTNERSGPIYLVVAYDDILSYGEGEYYVPVDVAPLVLSRLNGRDTVVIRHGDNVDVAPGNEALFVESSEGNVARFYGGGGVKIEGAIGATNALSIVGKTNLSLAEFRGAPYATTSADEYSYSMVEQSNSLAWGFSRFSNWSSPKVSKITVATTTTTTITPTNYTMTDYPLLSVEQNGSASAVKITGSTNAETKELSSTTSTSTKKTTTTTSTGSTSTVVSTSQSGPSKSFTKFDCPLLSVEQNGTASIASFKGTGGVRIEGAGSGNNGLKIKGTTDSALIYADQDGTGYAAYFQGGSGVRIDYVDTSKNALSISGGRGVKIDSPTESAYGLEITTTNTAAGLYVNQGGTGTSATFSGGSGVKIEGDLSLTGNVTTNLTVKGRIQDATGHVMPVGAIIAYGGENPPAGWLLCNGQSISAATYADLRTALGGKDVVPDLRSRFILGKGQGTGLSNRSMHTTGGQEKVGLGVNEMPSHSHLARVSVSGNANQGWGATANSAYWSMKVTDRHEESQDFVDRWGFVGNSGSGAAHDNMPPYYVLTYIIKY